MNYQYQNPARKLRTTLLAMPTGPSEGAILAPVPTRLSHPVKSVALDPFRLPDGAPVTHSQYTGVVRCLSALLPRPVANLLPQKDS